jgi:hypothetical protein
MNQKGVQSTDDQAFHFIFPQNRNAEDFFHPVVVFVCAAAGGHDAEVASRWLHGGLIPELELAQQLETMLDPVVLEVQEVQSPAFFAGLALAREVHDFRQGTPNLGM